MARVGEGDPRWIVSERDDGANVNAWHWQERDLSEHTQAMLKKAFTALTVVEQSDGLEYLRIDEASDVNGDVTVAQRKGKMMCYFEVKATLKWSSKQLGSDDVVSGKAEIPEVDHDEFKDDNYEITITCQERNTKAEDVMRSQGRKLIRKTIEKYFDALFEEYHIGTTVKSGAAMPPPPPPVSPPPSTKTEAAPAKGSGGAAASEGKATSSASAFSWRIRWRAPMEELFGALTDERRATAYTRGPARIDAKAGGQFQFLGGVITGYYVDLQPCTLIKQQWRLASWPAGVHSSVVITLTKEEPGVTLMEFAQSGIPDGQLQSVQEGWRANFFDSLKLLFGYSTEYL